MDGAAVTGRLGDHVMTDNRLTVTGQTTERLAGQAHLALVTRITMAE